MIFLEPVKRNDEKRWFKAILDIIREHRACALASVNIVQMPSGQLRSMPEVLALTTFSNLVEIVNRVKSIQERLFYIVYAHIGVDFVLWTKNYVRKTKKVSMD